MVIGGVNTGTSCSHRFYGWRFPLRLTTQPRRRDVNDETMREAFEKWLGSFKLSGHALDKNHDGEYRSDRTGDQWEAWKAAWNTRAQESAPEGEAVAEVVEVPTWQENVTQKGARL